jgi:hypothetical protein
MDPEEMGSLIIKLLLSIIGRERESFRKFYFCSWKIFQVSQILRRVFHATTGEVETRTSSMGIDSFVVHLRGGEGVTISISGDLPGPPHVVVAHGFPPDNGYGVLHCLYPLVDGVDVHLTLEL